MKERPIIFSTEMVKAILEGRKTQTRRIIKPRNESGLFQVGKNKETGKVVSIWAIDEDEVWEYDMSCPYGQPGDILWLREKWTPNLSKMTGPPVYYYAGAEEIFTNKENEKWKPSIHMPKEAARIWLEVTGIRIERPQDISEQDAIAEGVYFVIAKNKQFANIDEGTPIYANYCITGNPLTDGVGYCFAKDSFESLWLKINGAESWNQNPWVWVIEFKVLSTNGKP